MNKITRLFNEDYALKYLKEKLLPLYPAFKDIKGLRIKRHKDNVWLTTYHVVLEFTVKFIARDGRIKKLPIFCSAHSDEPRKNVYDSLAFLWNSGFGRGYLSVPHPLFYSRYYRATFYRGVSGQNLFYYIKNKDRKEVEDIIKKAAAWFKKLHGVKNAKNFNPVNSLIETVYPGIKHIIYRVSRDYPGEEKRFKDIYGHINRTEKEFLSGAKKRWLVHGDAHPENVIRMSKRKIGVIDFTDLCLSDFARDLGSFSQQLDFMIMRKIGDREFCEKMKTLFLDEYFSSSGEAPGPDIKKRIENYYNWTAMRTATYFLIKHKPEPDRAYPLIEQVEKRMPPVQAN